MALPAGASLPVGERLFGEYELISKLATGGMAEIFLARRLNDPGQAMVVIKRVLPHLEEEERFVDMFRDEARLASQIVHENVCRVYEAGVADGRNYIAMEYLSGIPLSNILTKVARERSTMGFRIVASILTQACEGLHEAHELTNENGELVQLVHRDMTPSNIFITHEGVVKILDFGVAKAHGASQKTRTGTLKGKNAYMSPEQILTSNIDRRSDLFSLGVVFWESLTAKRLFSRHSDFLTFRAITEEDVPQVDQFRTDCPPAIASIVKKALQKSPKGRFTTALELKASIEMAMEDHGGVASKQEMQAFLVANFPRELEDNRMLLETESTMESLAVPLRLPLQAPRESDDDLMEELSAGEFFHTQSDLNSDESRPEFVAGHANFDFEKTQESNTLDRTQDSLDAGAQRQRKMVLLGMSCLVALLALSWFGYRTFGEKGVVSAQSVEASLGGSTPSLASTTTTSSKNEMKRVRPDLATQGKTEINAVGGGDDVLNDGAAPPHPKNVTSKPNPWDQISSTDVASKNPSKEKVETSKPVTDVKEKVLTKKVVQTSKPVTEVKEEVLSKKVVQKNKALKDEKQRSQRVDSGNVEKPETKKVKKGTGFYSIDTVPYSIVYVDGKRVGETPLFKLKIPSGTHRIKAISSDGVTKSWKVKIVDGRHINKGSVLLK